MSQASSSRSSSSSDSCCLQGGGGVGVRLGRTRPSSFSVSRLSGPGAHVLPAACVCTHVCAASPQVPFLPALRPGSQGCWEPVLGGTALPSPVSVWARRPCPGHARAGPLQALPLPETLSRRGPPHPAGRSPAGHPGPPPCRFPQSTVTAAINHSRALLCGDGCPLLLGAARTPEGQVESRHSP